MIHGKDIIHCFCANALHPSASNSVRQIWPHTLFSKFQIWRLFPNASASHWKRCGGPHAAHRPV